MTNACKYQLPHGDGQFWLASNSNMENKTCHDPHHTATQFFSDDTVGFGMEIKNLKIKFR